MPGRRAWVLLGLAVSFAALIEMVPTEWSAVHLRQDLGASPGVAGLGPATVAGAMLVSRLGSDAVIDRLGAAPTARLAAWVVAVGFATGLALSGATGSPLPLLLGLAAVGLGAGPVFPLLFTAAARLPGGGAGRGASLVSGTSRAGLMAGPLVVGALGGAVGLGAALAVVPLAAVVVALVLPGRLRG